MANGALIGDGSAEQEKTHLVAAERLLRAVLASGDDPAPTLRAIARQDRVVLVLGLVIVYLGLAVSRG